MPQTGKLTNRNERKYRLDDQVGYILRLVSQRHAAIFQNHAIQSLTPTQFSALVRVSEMKQCSQNQLGRLSAMDVATIKGVVDRLNRKGLVVLAPDPNDKRRTLISLSPKAETLIGDLHRIGEEISRETLSPLNSEEQIVFLDLLRKLT